MLLSVVKVSKPRESLGSQIKYFQLKLIYVRKVSTVCVVEEDQKVKQKCTCSIW